MQEPHDHLLADRIAGQLTALRGRVGPLLGAALDGLWASLGVDPVRSPLANFTRTAQPVAHLPLWLAEAAAPGGGPLSEAVWAAVESAVMGYLCAQAQDAVIDGDALDPGRSMLLAHALFTRHQALLAPLAAGRPELWRRFEEVWLAYSEALLFEREANRGEAPVDEATFRRILRRSHPLALPGAALLAHLERWDLLPGLERFVSHSTMAAQLFDDLIDATADLQSGNRTWVVRRLGGERGPEALRRGLYLGGGFEAILDEALEELALAREAASALGMPGAARALEQDARAMEDTRRTVIEATAQHIFG